MTTPIGILKVSGAVLATLIAAWFAHIFSKVAFELSETREQVELTSACEALRDYSLYLYVLPLIVVVLGSIGVWRKSYLAVEIVCQFAWLAALSLVCFAVMAWMVTLMPPYVSRLK